MPLTIVTPATDYALALADANEHLRGIYDEDDAHLKRLIMAATRYVEADLGQALLNTVYDETFTDWGDLEKIMLSRHPLVSVTSVKYYDDDSVEQTWASSNYIANDNGEVEVAPDVTLPETDSRIYPWTIRYTAGYGTASSSVPHMIQHAMRLLVEDFDRFRGNVITGTISSPVAVTVRRLLSLNDTGEL